MKEKERVFSYSLFCFVLPLPKPQQPFAVVGVTESMPTCSFSLPAELEEKLRRITRERTMAKAVRKAVMEYLKMKENE